MHMPKQSWYASFSIRLVGSSSGSDFLIAVARTLRRYFRGSRLLLGIRVVVDGVS